MHRTQGNGYVLEGGLRRSHDRQLPTYVGTVMPSELVNAFQEELANAIERAGLTLNATAAADRTAGWGQLEEALFDSEALGTTALEDGAVTTDKIYDCDLSKLSYDVDSGGADITRSSGGVDYGLYIDLNQIALSEDHGVLDSSNFLHISTDFVSLSEYDSSEILENVVGLFGDTGAIIGTEYTDYSGGDYQQYTGSPLTGFTHSNVDGSVINDMARLTHHGLTFTHRLIPASKNLKFHVVDFSGVSWSGSGPYYASKTTALEIAYSQPIMAQFRYRVIANNYVYCAAGTDEAVDYHYCFEDLGSGFWVARVQIPNDISSGTDQRWLCIWYATV